jgi:hypothetical protein
MTVLQTVKLSEVKEIWESISGWYWFVTEYHEDDIAFGLVRGFETEWGYFSLKELRAMKKRYWCWPVHKKNWDVCPCIEDDTEEQEDSSVPAQHLKGGTQP